jgi:hypothetical protein
MLQCVFVKLSFNRWAQAELERLIQRLQKYTGVGCGDGVLSVSVGMFLSEIFALLTTLAAISFRSFETSFLKCGLIGNIPVGSPSKA